MLKSIDIENIAVIEKSNIELSNGFCVLTGETGAGKSIVIDSINAVLGERTSKDLIRSGCKTARVFAEFQDISKQAIEFLNENGIEYDGTVVISRVISSDSKNSCRINGVPVTASMLKEIGKHLINIHGQHDSQMLLNSENHLFYIDSFAENEDLKQDYLNSFLKLRKVKKQLKELDINEEEKLKQIDLLNFQIDEIEKANIKIGETEELNNRKKIIKNIEKFNEILSKINFYLNGSETVNGAEELVKLSANNMLNLMEIDTSYESLCERLNSVSLDIEEISAEVRNKLDDFNIDANEIEEIEQRLNLYYTFSKKYGQTEEDILNYLEKAKAKLEGIRLGDEKIKQLSELQDILTEEVYNKGLALTNSRKVCAEKFCKEVCNILNYLEMPNVTLVAKTEQGIYTKNGCDKLEFLITANVGEQPKPLSKIASGGELSRIMLAIKSVMAEKDYVDTLIFDEIDSGISGRAAQKVGNQLKKLSETHQVICVTHLAQIAAAAENHLLIEKNATSEKTYTTVRTLLGEERIKEIGRIISGTNITDNVYNTAKELLNNS